jgi:hypothetical protein
MQKRIFGARRRWEEEAEKAFRFSSLLFQLQVVDELGLQLLVRRWSD